MATIKAKDNGNQGKSKTEVDVKRLQHEFETARAEAEKAAMKYGRRCNNSKRSPRKNSGTY